MGLGGWDNSGGGADLMQMMGNTTGLAILDVLDEGSIAYDDVARIFDGEVILLLFCLNGKPDSAGIHPIAALVLGSGVDGRGVPLPYHII